MKKVRPRKKKSFSLKRIVFGGLFFCLLAGLVYLFVFSPIFWVKNIEVTQVKNVSASEVKEIVQRHLEERLWQLVPQKSIVLVPVSEIKVDILENFPGIKSVAIYKKAPDFLPPAQIYSGAGLEIEIEERKSIGVWCQIEYEEIEKEETEEEEALTEEEVPAEESAVSQEIIRERKIKQCFYIDKEGVIYKESPRMSGSLVLNIYSTKNESVGLGTKVISPEMIDFILVIKEELPKIKTAAGPLPMAVDFETVGVEDLKVTTSAGWQIYFSPSYSIDSQIKNLEMVLDREIKEARSSLKYVDLRIEGRVYYKAIKNP